MAYARSLSAAQFLRRYPRLVGHIIAASLGYYTPSGAASLLADLRRGREHESPWIDLCFEGDSEEAVRSAFERRHSHKYPMSSYERARDLVQDAIRTGEEPVVESWSGSRRAGGGAAPGALAAQHHVAR